MRPSNMHSNPTAAPLRNTNDSIDLHINISNTTNVPPKSTTTTMLLFCPTCSNLLTISRIPSTNLNSRALAGQNAFICSTCPYLYPLQKRYYERKTLQRKDVDDILGGADAWDNVDRTSQNCTDESCGNGEAYFYQLQIRSADEPMTSFFKVRLCESGGRIEEGVCLD